MKRSQPKRDWTEARAKVDTEGACRICGTGQNLEAAHLAGRRFDRPRQGRSILYVDPVSVIPLCRRDHQLFDAHQLDVLGVVTTEEQARAVMDLGSIETARIRLAPSEYRQVAA